MFIFNQYRNASHTAPGTYRNVDSSSTNFFVRVDDDNLHLCSDFTKLSQCPIAEQIYFSPNSFPQITRIDFTQGSAFDGWVVPSSAYTFTVYDQYIEVDEIPRYMPLYQYYLSAIQLIENQIISTFCQNESVSLYYSGGIDSMVLLSFIMRLGLLPRTKLIYIKNTTHTASSCFSSHRLSAINALLESLKGEARAIDIQTVDADDIATLVNDSDYFQLTAYCSAIIANRFPADVFIHGDTGNQTLLHNDSFITEKFRDPLSIAEFTQFKAQNNLYSAAAVSANIPTSSKQSSLSLRHIRTKFYNKVTLPNRIICPLANQELVSNLRQLNIADVPMIDILNAQFAKKMLFHNVGRFFDEFITTEHSTDGDCIMPIFLDRSKLNLDILQVPLNVSHNVTGVAWLHDQLSMNQIELNTVLSIKLQQFIYQMTGNK